MSKRSEQLRQANRMAVEQTVTEQLKKFHSMGMMRGAYSMCQVVLEKAKDETKTADERLADIIEFCSKAKMPDDGGES